MVHSSNSGSRNQFDHVTVKVPQGVVWVHLYGAWRSSRPSAGQGVDEAPNHGAPARRSKLIQRVPERRQDARNAQGNGRRARRHVPRQRTSTLTTRAAFQRGKKRLWGCFDYLAAAVFCQRLNKRQFWNKITQTTVDSLLSLNIPPGRHLALDIVNAETGENICESCGKLSFELDVFLCFFCWTLKRKCVNTMNSMGGAQHFLLR